MIRQYKILSSEHTEKQPVILSKNVEETGENASDWVDHMRKHSPVAERLWVTNIFIIYIRKLKCWGFSSS